MPIREVPGGYEWGGKGKVYPTRAGAEKQAAAAHANGFVGDDMAQLKTILNLLIKLVELRNGRN